MSGFQGCSRHSLDDKARLILPKRFLDQVAARDQAFTLTAGPDGCLLLMDQKVWEEMASRFTRSSIGNKQMRATKRFFLGHAEAVQPDKASRIVLPDALRRYAKIDPGFEVVLVGAGSMVEIWAATHWDKLMETEQPAMLFEWDDIGLAETEKAART